MSNNIQLTDEVCSYQYNTEYYHHDNAFTMDDFLDNYLSKDYILEFKDGSYAEVINVDTGNIYSLDAKGDGDSFCHVINYKLLN